MAGRGPHDADLRPFVINARGEFYFLVRFNVIRNDMSINNKITIRHGGRNKKMKAADQLANRGVSLYMSRNLSNSLII